MAKPANQPIEARINAILVLLAMWMGAWVIVVWANYWRAAPETGMTNPYLSLGWQGIAAILAFSIWGVGFGLPRGNGIRRMSAAPLAISFGIGLLVLAGVL